MRVVQTAGTFLLFISFLFTCTSLAAQSAETEKIHYGPETVRLRSGDRLYVYTRGGKTFATLTHKGVSSQPISLSRGQYTDPKPPFYNLAIIGQTANGVVILRETYRTDANPNGYCGAGEEATMQIISTEPVFKETFFLKIESCVDNIQLADDDIEFNPKTSMLSIHWCQHENSDEKREYRIGKVGSATLVSSKATKLPN